MDGTQPPLKLFIVYPGDEIFLCLEVFPYKADIKPVDISPKSWSETWVSLEMKTIRENWKIEPLASSKSKIMCMEKKFEFPLHLIAACFKQEYSKMMVNTSCAMPWTHHFTGKEIVLWEKCTSQEHKDFFYKELEIVRWIIYDDKSPCYGNIFWKKLHQYHRWARS